MATTESVKLANTAPTAFEEISKMQSQNLVELEVLHRRLQDMIIRFIGEPPEEIENDPDAGRATPTGIVAILKDTCLSTARIITQLKGFMDILEEQG